MYTGRCILQNAKRRMANDGLTPTLDSYQKAHACWPSLCKGRSIKYTPCLDQIIIYIEVWSCVSVVAQVLKKPHIEKKDVNDKGNTESHQDFGSSTGKTSNSLTDSSLTT